MSFQTPITIADALGKIRDREYLLPAIQREFVWSRDKITRLFDSLMRGYPIGSFLMWQVEPANASKFVFYDVMRKFHERDHAHCTPTGPLGERRVTAVLDGQQRLTALNIGLRGAHTQKLPRLWANNPAAYPETEMYVDLLHQGADDDLGVEYDFRFLTTADRDQVKPGAAWFRVQDIMGLTSLAGLLAELQRRGLGNDPIAGAVLARLSEVVHVQPSISFFLEQAQELDKVLNIFIRVNSGGMILSYSDLLLSVATAQWTDRDARDTIHGLVDALNSIGNGFSFSKDLVLKTGLVLLEKGDIRFRVDNFDRTTMAELDDQWDEIDRVVRSAAKLLADFGFSSPTLTANSVLIPIAYYLHRRGVPDNYLTSPAHAFDREAIKRWVQRALIKAGVWGSGLDRLLTGLRAVIKKDGADGWPTEGVEREMSRQGKPLQFQMTEVDDLLDARYGSKRMFPLLALLYPGVDPREQFHEDHIFPRSILRSKTKLRAATVPEDRLDQFIDLCDRVPNLQLLRGADNIGKSDKLPLEWLDGHFPTIDQRESWLREYDAIGMPADVLDFPAFFGRRRGRMRTRLAQLLGVQENAPVPEQVESIAPADEPDPGNEGL